MQDFYTLDARKKAILKAVIEEYILTAEPVGSRTIAKKAEITPLMKIFTRSCVGSFSILSAS